MCFWRKLQQFFPSGRSVYRQPPEDTQARCRFTGVATGHRACENRANIWHLYLDIGRRKSVLDTWSRSQGVRKVQGERGHSRFEASSKVLTRLLTGLPPSDCSVMCDGVDT
jgi:hypothetical protein